MVSSSSGSRAHLVLFHFPLRLRVLHSPLSQVAPRAANGLGSSQKMFRQVVRVPGPGNVILIVTTLYLPLLPR